MRGKGEFKVERVKGGGITPAYAGKSAEIFQRFPEGRDHPRLCGEKLQGCLAGGTHLGSPPPMRGKDVAIQ